MHIVITGASSGIGAALARAAAARPGTRLTLVARREDRLRQLAVDLSCAVRVVQRDLSQPEAGDDWLAQAELEHGPVDVLVNNAGSQVVAETASVDVAEGEASLHLNLTLPLRLIRHVLPSMLERRHGHIINIASMAALAPTPRMTYYNASKAGLAAASEALSGELLGSGVHVLTVYPGIIAETELAQAALAKYDTSLLLRLQPTGTEHELARRVWVASDRRRPRLIYPRFNGVARWFPGIVRWFMDRFTPALRRPEQLSKVAP